MKLEPYVVEISYLTPVKPSTFSRVVMAKDKETAEGMFHNGWAYKVEAILWDIWWQRRSESLKEAGAVVLMNNPAEIWQGEVWIKLRGFEIMVRKDDMTFFTTHDPKEALMMILQSRPDIDHWDVTEDEWHEMVEDHPNRWQDNGETILAWGNGKIAKQMIHLRNRIFVRQFNVGEKQYAVLTPICKTEINKAVEQLHRWENE